MFPDLVPRMLGQPPTNTEYTMRQPTVSTDLLYQHNSNEAASYDQKHEKTQNKLLEEVRARIDFIGADWVDDSSDDSSSDDEASKRTTPPPPKRQVRMLDYACGTGICELPLLRHIFPQNMSANATSKRSVQGKLIRNTYPSLARSKPPLQPLQEQTPNSHSLPIHLGPRPLRHPMRRIRRVLQDGGQIQRASLKPGSRPGRDASVPGRPAERKGPEPGGAGGPRKVLQL